MLAGHGRSRPPPRRPRCSGLGSSPISSTESSLRTPSTRTSTKDASTRCREPLASLDIELREQIQAATAAQVAPLITTLQADGPVGPADLELIRLWLVGDAEYYVKMENDLPAWVSELNRLIGVLRDLRAEAVTATTMARVEATVRDALRVSADIVFYRQQEERIRSFQNAAKDLSRDDKRMIADLLAEKLQSREI
jgi:hypothetical protein